MIQKVQLLTSFKLISTDSILSKEVQMFTEMGYCAACFLDLLHYVMLKPSPGTPWFSVSLQGYKNIVHYGPL